MRKGFLGSLAALMAGGLALAQAPSSSPGTSSSLVPAFSLGRPVPLSETSTPIVDPQVVRTSGSGFGNPAVAPPPPAYAVPPPPPYGTAIAVPPTTLPPPGACPPAVCPPICPEPGGPRGWISAEHLLWWVKDGPRPQPMIPTAPVLGVIPPATVTALSAQTIPGTGDFDYGTFNGLRMTAGGWLDQAERFGLEASGFILERRSDGTNLTLTAPGALGLPFGTPTASAAVTSSTRFWGAEADGLVGLLRRDCFRVDVLAGFRYLSLLEELNQGAGAAATLGGVPVLARIADGFDTQNRFYGGQLGAKAGYRYNRFSADLITKVAMGAMHEVVSVTGVKSVASGGLVLSAPGGLFAQPTNMGRQSEDNFAVVPEVTLQVGLDVTRYLRTFIGYNFLYVSSVVRPGDQVDPVVNLSQMGGGPLVGPARPAPRFETTDFWAQGVNFGVEFRY